MSEDDKPERKVITLVQRSLVKTIAGRQTRFVEPGAGAEARLDETLRAGDVSASVSELIAVCVAEPQLSPVEVAALPERARARARVAVAEVMGVLDDYQRLAGSGDERLYKAMRIRNARLAADLKAIGVGLNDNVVRLARDAQRTLNELGGSAAIARLVESATQAQRIVASLPINEAVAQANRAVEQMRPAFGWVEQNKRLFADVAATQQRVAESLARSLEPFMRPTYFGALADIELVRPHYAEAMAKTLASINASVVPRLNSITAFARVELPALTQITEAVEAMRRAIAPDVARLVGSLGEGMRRALAAAAVAYAAWLERHWPEVYANPDHPAPVLFLIAALPMSIGLPLYQAVERAKRDDQLLDGLEWALQSSLLLDQVEAAVQASIDLDSIAKRRLVVALESVRDVHYIDAAPIVDDNNKFLVKARSTKAKKVEDLFEHLGLDNGYISYLNSWVFGDFGNAARHGALPDEAAHRQWVLRAVAALIGWFEYCAGNEQPMRQLVAQLELALGDAVRAS